MREKWALVVGVGRFQNARNSLQYSAKDASDFAAYLADEAHFKPANVTLLTDNHATARAVKEAFARIRDQAGEDDLVVIYFSSHGWPRTHDPTGLSYVLTYDADTSTQASIYATALQMVELAELGRWVRARRYALFLDTCFSGAAAPETGRPASGINAFTGAFQGLKGAGARLVIAASQANEQSWEDPRHDNGYFTYYLLQALRQKAGGQPLGSVYAYIRDHVSAAVAKEQGSRQNPVLGSFEGGEQIVLSGPAVAAHAAPFRLLTRPPLTAQSKSPR